MSRRGILTFKRAGEVRSHRLIVVNESERPLSWYITSDSARTSELHEGDSLESVEVALYASGPEEEVRLFAKPCDVRAWREEADGLWVLVDFDPPLEQTGGPHD